MYVTESDGFKWILRPGTDDGLGPGHETFLNKVMHIPSGGVFIDVGAHVGHFAVRLSKRASVVYAFEPGIVQYRGLLKNLDMNGITNVESIFAAISDKPGRVGTTIQKGGNNGQMRVVEGSDVTAHTLDSFFIESEWHKPVERIDLIKIDVQGHEAKVLAGMHKVAQKYKPRLVIELHDREFHDPSIWEGVQAELAKMNYKWTFIAEGGTNWWIEAVPNE